MKANQRLFLTKAGEIVPANHPDAHELLAAAGAEINEKRLKPYGLKVGDVVARMKALGEGQTDKATEEGGSSQAPELAPSAGDGKKADGKATEADGKGLQIPPATKAVPGPPQTKGGK